MAQEKKSVGEEVMEWAEKYWLIDKIMKGQIGKGEGETMHYESFRFAMIRAIDHTATERLKPTPTPTSEVGTLK